MKINNKIVNITFKRNNFNNSKCLYKINCNINKNSILNTKILNLNNIFNFSSTFKISDYTKNISYIEKTSNNENKVSDIITNIKNFNNKLAIKHLKKLLKLNNNTFNKDITKNIYKEQSNLPLKDDIPYSINEKYKINIDVLNNILYASYQTKNTVNPVEICYLIYNYININNIMYNSFTVDLLVKIHLEFKCYKSAFSIINKCKHLNLDINFSTLINLLTSIKIKDTKIVTSEKFNYIYNIEKMIDNKYPFFKKDSLLKLIANTNFSKQEIVDYKKYKEFKHKNAKINSVVNLKLKESINKVNCIDNIAKSDKNNFTSKNFKNMNEKSEISIDKTYDKNDFKRFDKKVNSIKLNKPNYCSNNIIINNNSNNNSNCNINSNSNSNNVSS